MKSSDFCKIENHNRYRFYKPDPQSGEMFHIEIFFCIGLASNVRKFFLNRWYKKFVKFCVFTWMRFAPRSEKSMNDEFFSWRRTIHFSQLNNTFFFDTHFILEFIPMIVVYSFYTIASHVIDIFLPQPSLFWQVWPTVENFELKRQYV